MDNMDTTATKKLHVFDILLLWFLIICWLVLFLSGTLINSEPYRDEFISPENGLKTKALYGLYVILTYTLTNVALLCIITSLLGYLGDKVILTSDQEVKRNKTKDNTAPRCSAMLRGFVIFITLIAGVLILGDDPVDPSQLDYIRLAGFMSVIAFLISYDPTLFSRLLKQIVKLLPEEKNVDKKEVDKQTTL